MTMQKWIRHGLVSMATLASLAMSALAQEKQPTPVDKGLVAIVNGKEITRTELDAVLKKAGPQAIAPTEEQKRQMKQEALALLIDDELMKEFLIKQGPPVDIADVNKQIAELAEGLAKQKKTLDAYLKEQGQSEAQLRTDVTSWLQWNGFVKKNLTDNDVKAYYEESKDFFDRVLVRVSHIVKRVSPDTPQAEREVIAGKLRALRKEILEQKIDFATAAQKNSQCTSAPNGGDIGFIPRKLAVEESFAKAAFALKVGEISDVVQDDYGLHLIKVTERKPGTPSEFAKITDQVRELCIEELRMKVLARQRGAAKVEVFAIP